MTNIVWPCGLKHTPQLTLHYESPGGEALDSPDNLTVTPRGGLVVSEDDASSAYVDSDPRAPGIENVNRLIGITPDGEAFILAVNTYSDTELAARADRELSRPPLPVPIPVSPIRGDSTLPTRPMSASCVGGRRNGVAMTPASGGVRDA